MKCTAAAERGRGRGRLLYVFVVDVYTALPLQQHPILAVSLEHNKRPIVVLLRLLSLSMQHAVA